jgi:hypothetical protein
MAFRHLNKPPISRGACSLIMRATSGLVIMLEDLHRHVPIHSVLCTHHFKIDNLATIETCMELFRLDDLIAQRYSSPLLLPACEMCERGDRLTRSADGARSRRSLCNLLSLMAAGDTSTASRKQEAHEFVKGLSCSHPVLVPSR